MSRRTPLTLLALLLVLLAGAVTASAGGKKFSWTKDGNRAVVQYQSFKDDDAYVTVKLTGRQRRGDRGMYGRIEFYALRCGGSGQCYSFGAGGGVQISETASWQSVGQHRLPDLPRRRNRTYTKSEPLDLGTQVMQARVKLCYDRNLRPDPCSVPRLSTITY